jgi:phage gpG-like protein
VIEFKFDQKQLAEMQRKFKQFPTLPLKLLVGLTNRAETIMAADTLSGQVLKVRSGRLRGSIQGVVDKSALIGAVGSGARIGAERVKYATIHVFGGVIKPKKGKYLAIPLRAAKTKSGATLRGNAIGPRDFQNTFVRRSKMGSLLIFQSKGKSIVPLFVLKRSVTIPRRDYIKATSEGVQREIGQIFKRSLDKVMK